MVGHVGMHAPDNAEPVGMAGDGREEFTHLQAALAMPGEGEWGRQRRAGPPLGLEGVGYLTAGVSLERDLAVERVEVAGAAVGEDVDHRPGPGWEVGGPGSQRRPGGGKALVGQQARGAEPA